MHIIEEDTTRKFAAIRPDLSRCPNACELVDSIRPKGSTGRRYGLYLLLR